MPRVRRKNPRRREWTSAQKSQLETGCDWFGAWGRGELSAEALAEMETAWHELHEELLASYAADWPCRRCWAWWQFSAPEPRDESIPEAEQLDRLSLLSEDEKERLWKDERRDQSGTSNYSHFRRPWSWWRIVSPEPRNYFVCEVRQLLDLEESHGGILSDCEKRFVAEPSALTARIIGYRTWLTDEERSILGLPAREPRDPNR